MWQAKICHLCIFSCVFNLLSISVVFAQIIPDSSLGQENSLVRLNATVKQNLVDLIEGGAIRGDNLFHSFEQFNLGEGTKVYFANPEGITRILTRVTGNHTSEILGTLGVDGAANLFLLNPNGILFGKNAALDVNGSFLVTTAESYLFDNNFEYSASYPGSPPLLTVNIPIGLQFGERAETIVNRSQVGLQIQPQRNLSIIGGNIFLEGGKLEAPTGRIELSSVAPDSFVKINPFLNNWTFDYTSVQAFQDLVLNNNSLVSTTGDGNGNIHLYGKKISLSEGSSLENNNLGNNHSGIVNLKASESIDLIGVGADNYPSGIFAQVIAQGNGSDINLDTLSLQIKEGGSLNTDVLGTGKGGNILIQTQDFKLITTNPNAFQSNLSATVTEQGKGDGGNLKIDADRVLIQDSYILLDSFGTGNAGKGNFEVGEMEVQNPKGWGFIDLSSYSTGDGGNFIFKGDKLILSNGAFIHANSFDRGDSGNVEINLRQLQLKDNASQISVAGFGTGKVKDLSIRASESLQISGIGTVPLNDEQLGLFSSGIFTSVESGANTSGGKLSIVTPYLQVSDGGKIAANLVGHGKGGDIFINAKTIEVTDTIVDDIGTRSGITAVLEPDGVGQGGNINIITENLRLLNGGAIFVDSKGEGRSGNLQIQAKNIEIDGISSGNDVQSDNVVFPQEPVPSQISALSKTDFSAGNVILNTENLNIRNGGLISVGNSKMGNAGNLNITAKTIRLENQGSLNAEVNAGTQGNINLTTNNIFMRDRSWITAKTKGKATGGNIIINNTDNIVLFDNSQILADAIEGNGGEINITTVGLFVSRDSLISASSESGLNGNVKIETLNSDRTIELESLPVEVIDTSRQVIQSCSAETNTFTVSGNGGLPENPVQELRGRTVWRDLRQSANQSQSNLTQNEELTRPKTNPENSITEFQRWTINAQGKIELVANNLNGSWLLSPNCQTNFSTR